MSLSDAGVSFVRTATPIVAGALLTSAAAPILDAAVTREAVAALLALVWYAVFRGLELAGFKNAGWFLGVALAPFYRLDTGDVAEVAEEERLNEDPA